MNTDFRDRLVVAAQVGEVVRVIYHRGSQPGTVREIAPAVITDDEVKARDMAAGIDKTFKLAYLELAGPHTDVPAYDPTVPAEGTYTLQAAFEPHAAELRALGWHVEMADISISVHRYFKSGKPRKGAEIALLFNEYSIDPWDDGNGWHEDGVKSTRPYYVSSPTFDRARTFAHLAPALALFLEEARKFAPRSS